MAPEVVSARTYAPPIDVWSFGCLLAHMSTGRPPYSGHGLRTVADILEVVASGRISPIAHMRPTSANRAVVQVPPSPAEGPSTLAAAPSVAAAPSLEEAALQPAVATDDAPAASDMYNNTPMAVLELASRCVSREPSLRPSFDEVADIISADQLIGEVMAMTPRLGLDPRPIGRLRRGAAPQTASASPHWAKLRRPEIRREFRAMGQPSVAARTSTGHAMGSFTPSTAPQDSPSLADLFASFGQTLMSWRTSPETGDPGGPERDRALSNSNAREAGGAPAASAAPGTASTKVVEHSYV